MKRIFINLVFIFILTQNLTAQNSVFGKNKVQYKYFQWQYIQTDHFDVYFSQNGYDIAQYTAYKAEEAYESIKRLLKYEINNRISIIVYNSHNEFQQTNVVSEYLEEGIGGVTELFKNRVVVPFEGDYKQFRHVIHHELVHAVLNDMFYGGSVQSLISSKMPVQLPLWMNEGICEYSSLKWDNNSDMFIRDATVHNYLPPIERLSGYFAYRGGQSVWYYIATKYGEQKIGEIFNKIKSSRSVENGFKASIGLSVKELSERWLKAQKACYWPDVAKREEPEEFSYKRLTNHTKDGNFYNTSPAISPQGDKIAFISDRDDFFDVYIMSSTDGEIIKKLVKGQRTSNFEELHLLTPGITWSPDGKQIALAVKAGETDAIMIIDVETGKEKKITINLDGIYSVKWGPDGNKLAFVGLKTPQSDIYLYDLQTNEMKNITNDIFADSDPVFSPDGNTIYFVSDRGDYITSSMLPKKIRDWEIDFSTSDIYSIDINTGTIRRITNHANSSKSSPVISSDGKQLLYVADINGINNIYRHDLQTGKYYPITNSISGIYQLSISRDGSKLAFASLNEAGFDIYLMLYPFDRRLDVDSLEPTEFIKTKHGLPRDTRPKQIIPSFSYSDTVLIQDTIKIVSDTVELEIANPPATKVDLSNFVFSQDAMRDTTNVPPPISEVDIIDNRDSEGNYIPRRYKLNFSPDLIYGSAGYNTFYGLEGSTIFAFSDMLGDHQIIFQCNLIIDLRNSDYGIAYYYLPGRIDWGFLAFHDAKFLYLDTPWPNTLYRFRSWGISAMGLYPISRFSRIDFSLVWLNLLREDITYGIVPTQQRSLILPYVSYVNDKSIWQGEWFGPNNGSRFNFTFYGTPKIGSNGLDMQTFTADYRSYNKLARELIMACRLSAGLSTGKNKQNFFIGGTENWLNYSVEENNFPIENVEDYAFLTPVLPLRGYNYAKQIGTHFAIANLEFRFPFLKYLIFGALPVGFTNIQGNAFLDVGSAWTDTKSWKLFGNDLNGTTVFQDLLIGTGFGVRLFILGIPLRIDVAWQFNYAGFSEPRYYFSIGPDI